MVGDKCKQDRHAIDVCRKLKFRALVLPNSKSFLILYVGQTLRCWERRIKHMTKICAHNAYVSFLQCIGY